MRCINNLPRGGKMKQRMQPDKRVTAIRHDTEGPVYDETAGTFVPALAVTAAMPLSERYAPPPPVDISPVFSRGLVPSNSMQRHVLCDLERVGQSMAVAALAPVDRAAARAHVMQQYGALEHHTAEYMDSVEQATTVAVNQLQDTIRDYDMVAEHNHELAELLDRLPALLLQYIEQHNLTATPLNKVRDGIMSKAATAYDKVLAKHNSLRTSAETRLRNASKLYSEKDAFLRIATKTVPKWLRQWADQRSAALSKLRTIASTVDKYVLSSAALRRSANQYATLVTQQQFDARLRTFQADAPANTVAGRGVWYSATRPSADVIPYDIDDDNRTVEHEVAHVNVAAYTAGAMVITARVACTITPVGSISTRYDSVMLALYIDAAEVHRQTRPSTLAHFDYVYVHNGAGTPCTVSLAISTVDMPPDATAVHVSLDPRVTYMTIVIQ
ncbi:ORF40L [Turbot reddish body iridovirus]|uniref:ORF40L n=1 Tax=Turbot reddish body iridovirus TaxID=273651 RepID=E2CTY5_ISKNV|nr:ORF40L [Turbot reddish body iridovirus]